MSLISDLGRKIKAQVSGNKEMDAERAYDLWASTYDEEPNNLLLALEEEVFSSLLKTIDLKDKRIADIGCGTGRHWPRIYAAEPAELIGYDISAGMLEKLRTRFPDASAYQLKDNSLPGLASHSCDLVLSSLTLGYIENLEDALMNWDKVLKAGGDILLTDYHPAALLKGGDRSFTCNGKTIAIKNYIHTLDDIMSLAHKLGLYKVGFAERKIDGSVRYYYEAQQALHVYERFKGVPIVYGLHLKKKADAAV